MTKGKQSRVYEIVQQTGRLDWNKVEEALSRGAIKNWAWIKHDKDIDEKGNLKAEHFHVAIRLNAPYELKYVAEWFGVDPQYVTYGKGRFSDLLRYLTHENAPDKHQYLSDEVKSNFDWQSEKHEESSGKRLNEIITDIVEGKIREFNYHQYISAIEYNKFNKAIINAYAYRKDKIKGVHREMDVVYITGDSGTGKTTFAKMIAEDKDYSVYVSSGSNDVLDDYKGQDCIILDDLRPSAIGLSDLLKMLDNHTASSVKSRYKNKVLECKLIIITTILDIDSFFRNVFSEEEETAIQLKRRCKSLVKMDLKEIHWYVYRNSTRSYMFAYTMPNVVLQNINAKNTTEDEVYEYVSNMLGGLKNLVDEVKKDPKDFKDEDYPFDNQIKLPFDLDK